MVDLLIGGPGTFLADFLQLLHFGNPILVNCANLGIRSIDHPLTVATLTASDAAKDPWSPAWDAVPPHRVALRPLWYRNDYPPFVAVRAARVGHSIALLLEWRDDSHDAATLRTEEFADGVAVQFALSDPPPFVGMGQAGAGGEVEIWYWRADRQAASEEGAPAALTAAYPGIAVDRYQGARSATPGARLYAAGEPPEDSEATTR